MNKLQVFSLSLLALMSFVVVKNVSGQEKIEIGFWSQAWFQHVDNGGDGSDVNDFMLRRGYLSVKAQATNYLSFFSHIAVDRLGQAGLDHSGLGLGTGIAFRDLWIALDLGESLKIQAGRMYVPLTRNFGTTSTKTLLTTDISFMQGGIRGGIFYTSKVGRDDGVTFWGNPFDGLLQYRLMVSEGMEDALVNPDDKLRIVGRIIVNLLEPEKTWFNQGTYLGQKKVLSFGAGIDNQNELTLNAQSGQDNRIRTIDGFFDHPLGKGAVTAESAFIHIENCTQANSYAGITAGDDARLYYFQAGYYFGNQVGPGHLQPYLRYENSSVSQKSDTRFLSGGLNYYVKGHNGKFSLDYTVVDPSGRPNKSLLTLQLAIGI